MMMKRVYGLMVLGVMLSMSSFAQKIKIDNIYFTLGTFEDYRGRWLDPRTKDQVDYYYQYEKPLAYYVDSLLSRSYPLMVHEMRVSKNRYEIYSGDIEKAFEQYYDYKPTKSYTTKTHEPILYGVLKAEVFKSEIQKLSFLAGTYARFGRSCDTAYCIRVANSASKVQVCNQLLKEFNCKPYYQIISSIPTGHVVYFHPDKKVKAYMDKYNYLRTAIDKSMTAMTDSMMLEAKKRSEQRKAAN